MLSNVQIIEIASNNLIAEYSIELVDDRVKEDYFDEAWDNAVDDGLVEESSRLAYSIQFADKAEKLEELTNPPNQHPLPNP
ncbi:MAG: hypothetical protein U1D41_12925 [Nitrosomonas sp.]|uniref:hypothetical protein n=1 Tax=Nitrosomonas sp. TaxID=42353 RepID=UPI002720AFE4|nr:hypothetical protein [Nitrosomonas sp.]MDO8994475.1 hypothetical protein [Daejeonella sp.]MDP3663741.1 hypothetical protein [Nitrosomonas sp.]MDZ4107032.1 hypothetical protein [Nitrosomonas sp.]